MEVSLNITLNKMLTEAAKRRASHLHLAVGAYPVLRVDDSLVELGEEKIITSSFMSQVVDLWLSEEKKSELVEKKELIFVKEIDKNFRVRANFFFQKGFLSASLHLIPAQVPNLVNLGLPKVLYALTNQINGLVIVTGPYGSGRTTTVAAMLEEINKTRKEEIMTIEQPIEYLLVNKESIVEQREIGRDTISFTDALKYAKRTDINIIMVDSTQEPEINSLILEFASSGRLVFSVMDTTSVNATLEEIIASFDPNDRDRARNLISDCLQAIICQRLVPRVGGGLILATEVLIANDAVRTIIKDGKISQLFSVLQSSRSEGMSTMDQSLAELVKSGDVLIDKAIEHSEDPKNFRAMIRV